VCHECGLLVPLASSRERLDNNIGFSLRIKLFFLRVRAARRLEMPDVFFGIGFNLFLRVISWQLGLGNWIFEVVQISPHKAFQ
jgi:hypothetical protein